MNKASFLLISVLFPLTLLSSTEVTSFALTTEATYAEKVLKEHTYRKEFPINLSNHTESSVTFYLESSKLFVKNATQVENFVNMGRINPLYLENGNKILVEICQDHFPSNSTGRKEILDALDEFVLIKGTKINWNILNVSHKNADELISRNTQTGSLKIDFADADLYPNDCKEQGLGASWNLTRCGFTTSRGWKTQNFRGNLDAGAILINRSKYCPQSPQACLSNHPLKQGYLHEIAHYFGMTHVSEWPKNQKKFSSTMGAHQNYLTAYDVKYLRKHYDNLNLAEKNEESLAVMGRFKGDGQGIKTGVLDDVNPKKLYYDSADQRIKDCATGFPPKFQFGFFNRSLSPRAEKEAPVELRTQLITVSQNISIDSLRVYQVPSYSEIIWSFQGPISQIPSSSLAKVGKVKFEILQPSISQLPRHIEEIPISIMLTKKECL
jgi:hypothetical protein